MQTFDVHVLGSRGSSAVPPLLTAVPVCLRVRGADDLPHLPPGELPRLPPHHGGWQLLPAGGQAHGLCAAPHHQGRLVWKLHCPAALHFGLFHLL